LDSWGFNTIGNWSSWDLFAAHRVPYTVSVGYDSSGLAKFFSAGQPIVDVFDAGFPARMAAGISNTVASWKNDSCALDILWKMNDLVSVMGSRRSDPDMHKGFAATRPKESNFGLVDFSPRLRSIQGWQKYRQATRFEILSDDINEPISTPIMELKKLGWNADLDQQFAPHYAKGLVPARVAVEDKLFFRVWTAAAELLAQVSGKCIHEARRSNSKFPRWEIGSP